MKKKYQSPVTTPHAPPESIPATPPPPYMVDGVSQIHRTGLAFTPEPSRDLTPGFTMLKQIIDDLRACRDTQFYLKAGAHSFREWCVQQFGERFGCWLDDTL